MVQGTMSGVGKSTLVAALCRLLAEEGWRVAPFKAQNMSLNSAVTPEGLEISRAQAAQAEAAGIPPGVAMNPILLKPEGAIRLHVVVMGRHWKTIDAREYFAVRDSLRPVVLHALEELRQRFDLVILEGAGGAAELNLRAGDFTNMGLARAVGAPVVLVGDIERGGIFAQLLGTLQLLPGEEREQVRGLVVNKFRGDPALFEAGVRILEERSGRPVWGVLPYLDTLALPSEDSLDQHRLNSRPAGEAALQVAIVALPHMANFDEFEPLAREPDVRVRLVREAASVGYPDLLILPGSKRTLADLEWLRKAGLAGVIRALALRGVPVLGICGGFQMMGVSLEDPQGVESPVRRAPGLGLLPVRTRFGPTKTTRRVTGRVVARTGFWAVWDSMACDGYEIHMGQSDRLGTEGQAWLELTRLPEGDRTIDGCLKDSVAGTYCHGLLANDALRQALLEALWRRRGLAGRPARPAGEPAARAGLPASETLYGQLAGWLRRHLDLPLLYACVGVKP